MAMLDDAAFQEAILNGDYEALDKMADDHLEDEEEGTEETKAKKDEGEGTPKADETEDKAIEGKGDTPTDNEVVSDDDKQKVIEAGDTSTPADVVDDEVESKISFDENGNAIIPKELLAVVSKDGKHNIPYGVLESTRNKAKEAGNALEQERLLREEAEGKLSKNDRQAAVLKKQLEAAGIDPEQLPEDIEITPELMDSLDEYGDIGKVLKALVAKQGTAKEQPKQQEAATEEAKPDPRFDDYQAYVAKNPEFKAIMDNEGSDEQETLEHFYTQVTKSPAFKDKPLSEQLDEVMARTSRVMGKEPKQATPSEDENKAIAEEKVKEAKANATPASPSEVGLGDEGKGSALSRARAASGNELLKIMDELTQEELDALLDEAD